MSEVLGWTAVILLAVFVLWLAGRSNAAWSDFQAAIRRQEEDGDE